jgi:hypothetical protein
MPINFQINKINYYTAAFLSVGSPAVIVTSLSEYGVAIPTAWVQMDMMTLLTFEESSPLHA